MKIVTLLLTVNLLQIAGIGFSQNSRFDVSFDQIQLKEALAKIENQSNYKFVYRESDVENKIVTLVASNMAIDAVLDRLLINTGNHYRILENNLVIIASNKVLQQNKITGTVIDGSTGEPLIGVNIAVDGTRGGTTTDISGRYSIDAKPEDVLTFSYIGYLTEKVTVSTQTVIDVTLILDIQELAEVVVVGYGSVQKKDVTGAIASVNEERIKAMPVKDALQAMQGTTAGVDITSNQRPGEVGSIKIRGVRSINADQNPLYVVDGMVYQSGGIENINPSDIESVDILKDASATAIYGSRGANGVILVTTKHGKEGKVTLSYNGSVTVSKMYDVTEYMNTSEWLDYARIAKHNPNLGTYASATPSYVADNSVWGSEAASFANIEKGWSSDHTTWDGSKAGNTDWGSYGKRTGISTDHTVSISGGSEKFKGYGSFGYLRQEGTIADQNFERYSTNINFEATPVGWFNMGTSMNFLWSDQDYGYNFTKSTTGAGDYYAALKAMLPWTVPYDENGDYIRNPAAGDVNIINPINETKYNVNERQTLRATGSFYSQLDFGKIWNPLEGLKYRMQFGPEFKYYREGVFNDAQGINGDGSNYATINNYQTRAWTLDNLIYYNRTIASVHSIGLTLLQSASKYHYEDSKMKSKVATSDELWYNISSLGTINSYGSGLEENQMESYMARGNYSYKDKYLLTAAIRYDGASMLAEGNKWASFPSVAIGWRLEQEEFMKRFTWINALKLRLGYGVVGNSAVGEYETKGALTSSYYNWGTTTSSLGYVTSDPSAEKPQKMANNDLGWERTTQINYGLDYSVLSNRINGSIDVYSTKTDDLLMVMTIPSLTGYTSTWANVGKTKGWGIDIQLNTVNIQNQDFTWKTNIAWSKDESEIAALNNGRSSDLTNLWFVGEDVVVYYDYVYDGIWKTSESDEAIGYGRAPGKIKLKDLNKDGAIDANHDMKIVGRARPDWSGGITNILNYKNLEFSFFIYSRWGSTFKNGALTLDGRYMQRKIDYWVAGTNEDAKYYSPGSNGEAADTYSSSMNYQDGSFIKLRYINLGYNFSQRLLGKVGINSLKLYTQIQNPFMIYSKCDYLDTDLLNYDNNTTSAGSATTTRSWVFGVNVVF